MFIRVHRRFLVLTADSRQLDDLTQQVIGCSYKVANALGAGFLEKVYENALAVELRNAGIEVEQQKAVKVYYGGRIVGDYIADLLVEESGLVELKAAKALDDIPYGPVFKLP